MPATLVSRSKPCLSVAVLVATLSSLQAKAADFVLTAGLDDSFAIPGETAVPGPGLTNALGNQGFSANKPFDIQENNDNVGHTFLLSIGPNSAVTSATLTGRVRANTRASAAATLGDGVLLSAIVSNSALYQDEVAWSRNFGAIADNGVLFPDNDPGLLQATAWQPDDEGAFSLDLEALPNADGTFTNLLPLITERGLLDVVAGDDSAVDFYRLEYTVTVVPEPSSFAVLSALLAVGFGRTRRTLLG